MVKYYLAPDSALSSAPDSKIKKISILVPFWATIYHKTNFPRNTLHSSFISEKKILLSIADTFRKIHFISHFS